jgi:hypothetical protein
MLRTIGVTALADEWDASTGVRLAARHRAPPCRKWETITIMPMRFISRTRSRPARDRPLCSACPVMESANGLESKWASVM